MDKITERFLIFLHMSDAELCFWVTLYNIGLISETSKIALEAVESSADNKGALL